MTLEPKEVQLAREFIKLGPANVSSETLTFAQGVVAKYESNLEHGRQQEAKRQRAREETAKRWPELAVKGWWYEEKECYCAMHRTGLPDVYVERTDDPGLVLEARNGNLPLSVDINVTVALIDGAGLNTTANKLRDAIGFALHELDPDSGAYLRLKKALEVSNA